MAYRLTFAPAAERALAGLRERDERRHKKVSRALGRLQTNPRHPGLVSHEYENFPGNPKERVWESYVENHTPGVWRIFWMYGPDRQDGDSRIAVITVLSITSHP